MSLTIKDIANLAGVSHATVSRVLNNNPNVNPQTREKINKLIQELKYSPNLSARSLISGKTSTIGLLILYDIFKQQFPADFLPGILAGMASILNNSGYNLTLLFDQLENSSNQINPEKLNKKNMDGLFVLSLEKDFQLACKIARIDVPMVLVNQRIDGSGLDYVISDDEQGAYDATMHLLKIGHKNIGFIEGDPKYTSSVDRKNGYYRALKENEMKIDLSLEAKGLYDKNQGYLVTKELIQRRPDITAIFASNDIMALGAMDAIGEEGKRIPEDMALVGFDDTQFASVLKPGLTTVRKPRNSMGSEAAKLMLEKLADINLTEPRQMILPTTLIVRGSTVKSK